MTIATPLFCGNGHFQAIYPSIFRKVSDVTYTRERVCPHAGHGGRYDLFHSF